MKAVKMLLHSLILVHPHKKHNRELPKEFSETLSSFSLSGAVRDTPFRPRLNYPSLMD